MKKLLFVPLLIILTSCAIISKFDQNSYDNAAVLKVESLAIMAHGAEPFVAYAEPVRALKVKLDFAAAYENSKGKANFMTSKQWALLISPDHLLGNFLKRWEAGEPMPELYIKGEIEMVGNTFDQIIGLEGGKIK